MRSERWTDTKEITRVFKSSAESDCGAGPIVYHKARMKWCDDGESHIAALGRTGMGKSQAVTLPYMREIISKGECLIIVDPKGEAYEKNACFIPDTYEKIIINLRNPRKSPSSFNLLKLPYELYKSSNPDDNDAASSAINELWRGVFPHEGPDTFWPDAASNLGKALTYGLFETANKQYINLDSISVMLQQLEKRVFGDTLAKKFYDYLPHNSLAKQNLASYISAPSETRGSIHSVASAGFEVFNRSKGLIEMLSREEDSFNLLNLDVDKPFIFVLITPDERSDCDCVAGLIISQITQFLIRVAQERGGRLPIKTHLILEELGSIGGKAIPNLAHLMVAGRSRGLRITLILQSYSQLIDTYGKSKAETIRSCVGTTYAFSTNCWQTLVELSQRCGEKEVEVNGHIIKEPLITPAQLAAMPRFTALIMIENQFKFISHMDLYDVMYDNSDWAPPPQLCCYHKPSVATAFDFEAHVKLLTESIKEDSKDVEDCLKDEDDETPFELLDKFWLDPAFVPTEQPSPFNIDNLISKIDSRIADLEKQLEEEDSENDYQSNFPYKVVIFNDCHNNFQVIKELSKASDLKIPEVAERLKRTPAEFYFTKKKEATKVLHQIEKLGAAAILISV